MKRIAITLTTCLTAAPSLLSGSTDAKGGKAPELSPSSTQILLEEAEIAMSDLIEVKDPFNYESLSIQEIFNIFEKEDPEEISKIRFEYLCDHELELRNKDGMTLLNLAVKFGSSSLVRALIKMGADVNTADSSGWTPLMWAVGGKDEAMVSLLLAKGSQLEKKNCNGIDAKELAVRVGFKPVEGLIITHGISLANRKQDIKYKKFAGNKKNSKRYFSLIDESDK